MTGVSWELVKSALLALALLLVVLVTGQLAKVGDLLLAAGDTVPWARALGLAGVVLMEALLPLVGLLAAGLTYARQRGEGALVARAALGFSPWRQYAPAVVLGVALGGTAAAVAWTPGPAAVRALGALVLDAAIDGLVVADRPIELGGGGVLRTSAAGTLWMVLPAPEGATLMRASSLRATQTEDGPVLTLREAYVWAPGLRVQTRHATLRLNDVGLGRRLGMFGPPNATDSGALDGQNLHHRFIWHRRLALPAAAPLWALWGALLGGAFGGVVAVVGGAAAVGGAYWILRVGELTARAGMMSPALAAWVPVLVLALLLMLLAPRWARRLDA